MYRNSNSNWKRVGNRVEHSIYEWLRKMLGLRLETDPIVQRLSNVGHHPKSHKFAESLAGRFFVSGVSGGFRKSRRNRSEDDEAVSEQSATAVRQAELRLKREEQMRRDAERLFELENKLEEVRTQAVL